jgi:hypothetical protein
MSGVRQTKAFEVVRLVWLDEVKAAKELKVAAG